MRIESGSYVQDVALPRAYSIAPGVVENELVGNGWIYYGKCTATRASALGSKG